MEKYHKIQSIFKRYAEGPKRGQFIPEEFAIPEFRYLYYNTWVGTEKIDGTNIRIIWDGNSIHIRGKTDNAQIHKSLVERIKKLILSAPDFNTIFNGPATLYGEGYGVKIQNGGKYIPDGNDFILFDVKIDNFWLKRDSVEDVAKKLNIKSVPVIFEGTLQEAIKKTRGGFLSTIGTTQAEGMVLVPAVEMFSRNGERIITKIKTKDKFDEQ